MGRLRWRNRSLTAPMRSATVLLKLRTFGIEVSSVSLTIVRDYPQDSPSRVSFLGCEGFPPAVRLHTLPPDNAFAPMFSGSDSLTLIEVGKTAVGAWSVHCDGHMRSTVLERIHLLSSLLRNFISSRTTVRVFTYEVHFWLTGQSVPHISRSGP
jgi:hypothetical protein